jgi:propionyl-CoA synthetase
MNQNNKSDNIFDVIIIGAGTAGSLLAARLSTNPVLQILVLEAGHNRNDDANVRTPSLSRNLLGNPVYDWQFQTSPEAGLRGRVIQHPRGKLWGGSSAINSHALVYPSRRYHDVWAKLLGSGIAERKVVWDWEGIRKFYRRFQTVQMPNEDVRQELGIGTFGSEEGRGHDDDATGGGNDDGAKENSEHIQASFPTTVHVLQKAWADTFHGLGYSDLKDPVDGKIIGGSTTTNAIDSAKGERSHAGVAFLDPAMKRKNVVIRSDALVERILFDENKLNGRLVATGVLYSQNAVQAEVTVYARHEVIICAGTFGSPKILELSGIGQRNILAAAGIGCLHDLPGVGGKLAFIVIG